MSEPLTETFDKYKLRPLNFGDINAINRETIFLSEKQGMSVNVPKMLFLTVKKGIMHKDGTPLTDDELNNLDDTTAREACRRILLLSGKSLGVSEKELLGKWQKNQ